MRRMAGVSMLILILLLLGLGTAQAQKITITIQDYFDPTGGMAKFVDRWAEEYMKNNPDVEIKHVYIPFAQLLPTILQQALTGTLPEVVMADNPWVPNLIKAGVYLDITDRVKEWGWENWEDFFKGHRDLTSSEGKIYAFQITTNNLALFYRKSILDKAGIAELPTTWEELKSTSAKIKEVTGAYGFGFCATSSEEGTWQFEPFLWSNGGSLLEIDEKEAIEALAFLTEMVEKGYTPRDVVNISGQGDITQWFINGEVAMMENGNWEFGWHLTPDVLEQLGDVGVAALPVPQEGLRPIVPFGGECYGIGANTTDPKKLQIVWEFLRYVASTDGMLAANLEHGGLPTRASAAEKIRAQRPILAPFLEQAKYALPRPLVGGMEKYPDVSSTVWTAMQQALTGIKTPEEALKEAAANIRGLFSPEEFEAYKKQARELINAASGK
ncbi:MAG: ABC transporter substrate-binding protein [Candidatus Caldatribacteriaceae bacterium]